MKYSSNFEGVVVEYEPWAVMPVAQWFTLWEI